MKSINLANFKATTLDAIKKHISYSCVPKFLYFSCDEYEGKRGAVLDKITTCFNRDNCVLAIRSSAAVDEDQKHSAKAGEYHTELNIAANEIK